MLFSNVMADDTYAVWLLDVPRRKRGQIVDILSHERLQLGLSQAEAFTLIRDVPVIILNDAELDRAVTLEMLLEVAGATVDIAPA